MNRITRNKRERGEVIRIISGFVIRMIIKGKERGRHKTTRKHGE